MKILADALSGQPAYRLKQIHSAWFDVNVRGYGEITTLSKELREKLEDVPWLSVKLKTMQASKLDDTKKALLELNDGASIETVLMGREGKKEKGGQDKRYTVCLSSQVGCPMGCKFCATGRSGFTRNLTAEEIIDQVRFWQRHLHENTLASRQEISNAARDLENYGKISNIVIMGQGEPFLNYENVKEALKIILANTDIGPSKITVSTVGIPALMNKMLEDPDFPAVRIAISLHSAVDKERGKIIPSNTPGFTRFLIEWAQKYHTKFASRALFLGIEYTMLDGVNDDDKHLKALIKLVSNLGRVRINLIPYNCSADPFFRSSPADRIEAWHDKLLKTGFVCTIRRSQGQDIAAACGQLRNLAN